jgi:uncharacterized protein with HEPN domain
VQRDHTVFLQDIVEACGRIARYTEAMTLEELRADEKTLDAVVRNLEILGEASKKIRRSCGNDYRRSNGVASRD